MGPPGVKISQNPADAVRLVMELITLEEAGEILGVSTTTLSDLIRKGLLRARIVKSTKMLDRNEVYQLKEIRASNLSLQEIAARAMRAEMAAFRLERVVTQLLNVIGADIPSANVDQEAVTALHFKVEDALAHQRVFDINDIMFWGQTFQSLSEQYFQGVADTFNTEEPWKQYIALSNKLLTTISRPSLRNDLELSTAYNFLEMARKGMRQTIFMYVGTTYSRTMAYRLIPESTRDIHEGVLTMASMIFD